MGKVQISGVINIVQIVIYNIPILDRKITCVKYLVNYAVKNIYILIYSFYNIRIYYLSKQTEERQMRYIFSCVCSDNFLSGVFMFSTILFLFEYYVVISRIAVVLATFLWQATVLYSYSRNITHTEKNVFSCQNVI